MAGAKLVAFDDVSKESVWAEIKETTSSVSRVCVCVSECVIGGGGEGFVFILQKERRRQRK